MRYHFANHIIYSIIYVPTWFQWKRQFHWDAVHITKTTHVKPLRAHNFIRNSVLKMSTLIADVKAESFISPMCIIYCLKYLYALYLSYHNTFINTCILEYKSEIRAQHYINTRFNFRCFSGIVHSNIVLRYCAFISRCMLRRYRVV